MKTRINISRSYLFAIIAALLLLMVAACQAPAAAPVPAATDVPPTEVPEPTATAIPPTTAPEPTATPIPPTVAPASQAESDPMVGTWVIQHVNGADGFFMQLNADGSFATAVLYKDFEKFPQMKGSYEIDGDVLSLTVDAGRTLYCEEETGQYTVIPVGPDQFHLDRLAWDCGGFKYYVAAENAIWERYSVK